MPEGLRDRVARRLGRVEERLRVRLHQAANRVEDGDPVGVGLAEVGIRALNAIDRVTGFRARDRRNRLTDR